MTSPTIAEVKPLDEGALEITPKQKFTLAALAGDVGNWAASHFGNIPGLFHHVAEEGLEYTVYLTNVEPDSSDDHIALVSRRENKGIIRFNLNNHYGRELAQQEYRPTEDVLEAQPSSN